MSTHHMAGKQNRLIGPEPASAVLTVRVMPTDKDAWTQAAQDCGLSLSQWVINKLNQQIRAQHE